MAVEGRVVCQMATCLGFSHVLHVPQGKEQRPAEGDTKVDSAMDSDPDSSMSAGEPSIPTHPESDVCFGGCASSPVMDTGTRSPDVITRGPETMTPDASPEPTSLEMDCSPDGQASSATQSSASAVPAFWEDRETSPMDNCNLPEYQAEMKSSPESTATDFWDEYDAYGNCDMDDFSHYQTAMGSFPPPASPVPNYRPFPACDDVTEREDHARAQCMESRTKSTHGTDGHVEYPPSPAPSPSPPSPSPAPAPSPAPSTPAPAPSPSPSSSSSSPTPTPLPTPLPTPTPPPHTDNRPSCTPQQDSCSANVLMSDGDSCLDSSSHTSRPDAAAEVGGVDENSGAPEARPEYRPDTESHVCPTYTATPKGRLSIVQPAPDTLGRLEHELVIVDRSPHHPDTQVHTPGQTRVLFQRRLRPLKSRGSRSSSYRSRDPRAPYSGWRREREGEVDRRPDPRGEVDRRPDPRGDGGRDPGHMTRSSGVEPPVSPEMARLRQIGESSVVFESPWLMVDPHSLAFSRQD